MRGQIFVFRNGEWVDKATAAPLHASAVAPNVRPDGMDAIQSMANGRMYDSKSAYYADLKARGCEIVGNERHQFDKRPEFTPHGSVERDIKRALAQHGMGD